MTCGTQHPAEGRSIFRSGLARFAVAAVLTGAAPAHAFIYTVGASGTNNNCSFPTIQEALDKAASTTEDDEIWITRDVAEGWYRSQALVANDADEVPQGGPGRLRLVGGFDDCWDQSPEGMTELDGNGGAAAPVLTIHGFEVTIENLRLTRGDATGGDGGGIAYAGSGMLVVRRSLIDNNEARRGGGISFTATAGNPRLLLENTAVRDNRVDKVGGGILLLSSGGAARLETWNNVDVDHNFAWEGGGGFAIGGGSTLVMQSAEGVATGPRVEANGTMGSGGAILAVSPVTMRLAAGTREGTAGTFVANEAWSGAAIAIGGHPNLGQMQGSSSVFIGSDHWSRPQVLAFNRAHGQGGVLHVDNRGNAGAVDVCTWNVGMTANDAAFGGTIAMVAGIGAIYRNEPQCVNVGQPCEPDACNRVDANRSTNDAGENSDGSLYEIAHGGVAILYGVRMLRNSARYVFRERRDAGNTPPAISAQRVLLAGNSGVSILSQCEEDCHFDMKSTTVVDNLFAGWIFDNAPSSFLLFDSIVDQPGRALFEVDPAAGGGLPVARLLHNTTYASDEASVIHGTPTYFDASAGDYRLAADSPGVDMAPAEDGNDVRGWPGSVDLPWVADAWGPRDLGAIETQLDDVREPSIFASGFESIAGSHP